MESPLHRPAQGDLRAQVAHSPAVLAHARVSPKWWSANPGAVLVIPRGHHENFYDIPSDVGHAVCDLTQRVAVAMRATYDCAGISTRQHNEPAGNQDVWHLHVHVFPRHRDDALGLPRTFA